MEAELRKAKEEMAVILVALSMTPPSSQNSSEETAMEKIKRESEEALAIERAKREESDYERMVEISNFTEINDGLQESVTLMLKKAEESQLAEREEKEELLRRVQELTNSEAQRQAEYETENAWKMNMVEEEKTRTLREAKLEADKKIQAAEDAKQTAIRLMQEREAAAARAESQRLADLQLTASSHLYKKVLESVSGGMVETRYVTSGLHNSSLKTRIALNKLNLAMRQI